MDILPTFPDQEARRQQELRSLYERVRDGRHSDVRERKEIGKLVDEFRALVAMTAAEFAKRCGVSQSSYYRWLSGDPIPPHRIEKLRDFLQEETPEQRAKDSIISGDRRLNLRTLDQLLDRMSCCKTSWVMKHLLPYRAGRAGKIRDDLFKHLRRSDISGEIHCVFRGNKDRGEEFFSPYPAQESFGEFKQHIFGLSPEAAKKLHGWCVFTEEMGFRLGLTNNFIGHYVLEYDIEKKSRIPNLANRDIDILFEIPVAVYQAHNHLQLTGDSETRWIELGSESTAQYWKENRTLLHKLADGKCFEREGVVEFLAEEQEIQKFSAKRF